MSMRILGALGFAVAAMTGGAQASSFVFLGVATSTPSVIKVGRSEPIKIASTPSIIALGEAQPDVTYEKVAAIPEMPRHGHAQDPMVIRGGVVGNASPAAAPAKANTTKPSTAAAPAADKKPAAEPGTATAANDKPQTEPPATPQPAASKLK